MDILNNRELNEINGGSGAAVGVLCFIGGLIVFGLGLFCGFFEKHGEES